MFYVKIRYKGNYKKRKEKKGEKSATMMKGYVMV
jgi:hypothetical protein